MDSEKLDNAISTLQSIELEFGTMEVSVWNTKLALQKLRVDTLMEVEDLLSDVQLLGQSLGTVLDAFLELFLMEDGLFELARPLHTPSICAYRLATDRGVRLGVLDALRNAQRQLERTIGTSTQAVFVLNEDHQPVVTPIAFLVALSSKARKSNTERPPIPALQNVTSAVLAMQGSLNVLSSIARRIEDRNGSGSNNAGVKRSSDSKRVDKKGKQRRVDGNDVSRTL